MTEYLVLYVLVAVSLIVLGLLARMLLKMRRVEGTAEVKVVKLGRSEREAEVDMEDIEEDVEKEREEEAPQKQAPG